MSTFLLLLRLASALLKAMCSYNKIHLLTSLGDRSGQVSITIHINLIRQGFGESSLKEGMLRSIHAFFSLPSFSFLCLEYKCDFEGEATIFQPWSNETWDENYTQDGHAKCEKALFLISKRPVSVLNSQTFGFFVFEHYEFLVSSSYCRQFSVNLLCKEECHL